MIPIVSFISHRNTRGLRSDLLDQSQIADIDRGLINVVSQHSTDMRLLRMYNEYLVFAERLLEPENSALGMDPSKLFALVTFKNFHLEDLENISRRDSDLDRGSTAILDSCVFGTTRWRLHRRHRCELRH